MTRRWRRPDGFYELLTCAWSGHVLVGTDAEQITPSDHLVAREVGGTRWYRCLRCDAWVTGLPPDRPSRDHVPQRDQIELPARGPILRDRYVLRLIAVERSIHVIVFGFLAVALFLFASNDATLHRDYLDVMNDLNGGSPGEAQVRGVIGILGRAFKYSPQHLRELAVVLAVYAAMEATEMVGLWQGKRWAEYLTFVATTLFVPFEIYELTHGVTAFKTITLVINVAIVLYLLVAKRLFGLRGGQRAISERRDELGGWEAIERATPPPEPATTP
jgi:uncharacterized membrane protein (DUF2068 family)